MSSISYVELNRRFERQSSDDDPEQIGFRAMLSEIKGKQAGDGWAELFSHPVSVIRGEAGSGKTTEIREQAQRLRVRGHAFVLRLNDLAEQKFALAFDNAADIESADRWRRAGGQATIFLDALDEVRLFQGRYETPLRSALECLRANLQGVLTKDNARLIITTRPGEWRGNSDAEIVKDHFTHLGAKSPEEPAVFRLTPLSRSQIKVLLDGMEVDAAAVLHSIDHAQAADLVRQPLEVRLLADAWKDARRMGRPLDRAFADRTELFDRAVGGRLREGGISDPRLQINLERARLAAERLAAACVLSGEPDLKTSEADVGLDAVAALSKFDSAWTSIETRQLLSTALFTPGRGDALRFAHKELRDYLAAWFFSRAIARSGGALEPIFPLLGRAFGMTQIPDSSVGVMAWIAALNAEVKRCVSELRPEILIQGGDPIRLSDSDKVHALRSLIQRIGQRNYTGVYFYLEDMERFACPGLEQTVKTLVGTSRSIEAREALVALASAGGMLGLAQDLCDIATDQTENRNVRSKAAEAIADFGSDAQRRCVFEAVHSEFAANAAEIDHTRGRLIAAALRAAYPRVVDVTSGAALLSCLTRERRNYTSGNDERIADALSGAPEQDRLAWISELNRLLRDTEAVQSPASERVRVSQRYHLLMPALAEFTSIELEHSSRTVPLVLDAIETCQFGAPPFRISVSRNSSMNRLRRAIAARPDVFMELFWRRSERFSSDDETIRVHRTLSPMLGRDNEETLASHRLVENFIAIVRSETNARRAEAAGEAAWSIFSYLPLADRGHLWRELWRANAASASEKLRSQAKAVRSPINRCRRWITTRCQKARSFLKKRPLRKVFTDWRAIGRWRKRREAIRSGADINAFIFASRHATNESGQKAIDETVKILGAQYQDDFVTGYRRVWRTIDLGAENTWYEIIALHGFDLESDTAIENLSGGDLERAFSLALSRIAGLSRWTQKLIKFHGSEFRDATLQQLHGWTRSLSTDQAFAQGPLASIVHGGADSQDFFRPIVLLYAQNAPQLGFESCRYVVRYLAEDSGAHAIEIAGLAKTRFREAICEGAIRRAWAWAHLWLNVEADAAWVEILPWLEAFRAPLDPNGLLFFSELHEPVRVREEANSYLFNPDVLRGLITLAYCIARPAQDLEHEDTYSPGHRDNAQDSRRRLLNGLTAIPTQEARTALRALADDAELFDERDVFVYNLEKQMMGAAQRRFLKESETVSFLVREIAPPYERSTLFEMVCRHLRSALLRLRNGDDDEGRFFREKDADEDDLRNWLSGRLRDMGTGIYAVVRDPKVSQSKRPDIWFGTVNDEVRVVCEIKLAERWTGPLNRSGFAGGSIS